MKKRFSNLLKIIFPTIFALTALLGVTSTSFGQTTPWSIPHLLTPENQVGTFGEILADATGRVHVFWSSSVGDYDEVVYQSFTPETGWSEMNDIQALYLNTGRIITRPAAAIDPEGNIHLLFRNFTMYYSTVPLENASQANLWSQPVAVSSGDSVAYFGRLAFDSKNGIHLVYTENDPSATCLVCFGLYYRRSTDGGKSWSDPVRLNENLGGAAKPQLLVDREDRLHLIWEGGRGGDLGSTEEESRIMYSVSEDLGKTWKTPIVMTTPQGPFGKNPSLGLNPRGDLVIVWLALKEDIFYYSVSQDGGNLWSNSEPIPGIYGGLSIYNARTDGTAMETDSAGGVHVVLVGRNNPDQTSLSVLTLTWDGSTWSEPDAVITLEGDVPEWPRLAIARGNRMNVVWFVRDEEHIFDSDNGMYQVWFSERTLDVPEITPIAYDTVVPTITPTALATPTLAASQTPTMAVELLPTSIPIKNNPIGLGQPAYRESDYLLLVAKTLVPSMVFLGIVVVGVLIRRRKE